MKKKGKKVHKLREKAENQAVKRFVSHGRGEKGAGHRRGQFRDNGFEGKD